METFTIWMTLLMTAAVVYRGVITIIRMYKYREAHERVLLDSDDIRRSTLTPVLYVGGLIYTSIFLTYMGVTVGQDEYYTTYILNLIIFITMWCFNGKSALSAGAVALVLITTNIIFIAS